MPQKSTAFLTELWDVETGTNNLLDSLAENRAQQHLFSEVRSILEAIAATRLPHLQGPLSYVALQLHTDRARPGSRPPEAHAGAVREAVHWHRCKAAGARRGSSSSRCGLLLNASGAAVLPSVRL